MFPLFLGTPLISGYCISGVVHVVGFSPGSLVYFHHPKNNRSAGGLVSLKSDYVCASSGINMKGDDISGIASRSTVTLTDVKCLLKINE